MGLEAFVNDKFKVLSILYSHRIEVNGDSYTSLSQQEIANLINFSKQKTNRLVRELMEEGFIDSYQNLRGKYVVKPKGIKVIKTIEDTTL